MNIKQECQKAIATGISAASIARRINRNRSTLTKWLKGDRNLSKEIENEVGLELLKIKKQWENIMSE